MVFSNNGIRGTQSISLGPVGNVFVSSSNWQGTKSIMTYCWTCLYAVSRVHILSLPQPSGRSNTERNTAPKKEQWLIFGKPSISSAEHSESCCLFFECPTHFKRLAFVLKSYETLTWKSIICHSQFVQFFRSLFLIHYFIPVPSGTSLWLDTLRLTSKWRWNNVWDWKRGIHYTSHYIKHLPKSTEEEALYIILILLMSLNLTHGFYMGQSLFTWMLHRVGLDYMRQEGGR